MSISRWSAINKNFVQMPILDFFLSESVLRSFFETVAYITKLLDPCCLMVCARYTSIIKWSTIGKTVFLLICNMAFCSLCTALMVFALDYSPKLLILRVFVVHRRHMSISRWSAINKNFVQTPILDFFLSESVLCSFFETVAYITKLLDPCCLMVCGRYMSIIKCSTIGKTVFLLIFGMPFCPMCTALGLLALDHSPKLLILRVFVVHSRHM